MPGRSGKDRRGKDRISQGNVNVVGNYLLCASVGILARYKRPSQLRARMPDDASIGCVWRADPFGR